MKCFQDEDNGSKLSDQKKQKGNTRPFSKEKPSRNGAILRKDKRKKV